MPKTGQPQSTRRRGTRAATRERLLAATLELLHTGGESAVSTVSVTRAAGIAQSAFYQHFTNVEDCLANASAQVATQIREAVASGRRAMYAAGPGTGPDLEQFFQSVFDLALQHRPTIELYLRYRTDRLALNGVMHRLAAALRADLATDLNRQAMKAGLPAPPAGWVESLAEYLMGASLSAIEARLEGRGPDLEESARVLAAFSTGACLGVIQSMPSAGRAGHA